MYNKKIGIVGILIIINVILAITFSVLLTQYLIKEEKEETKKEMKQKEESENEQQVLDEEEGIELINRPFLASIGDVYTTEGYAAAVITVKQGKINVNDEVEIVGVLETKKVTIAKIEYQRKSVTSAELGQMVALYFEGLSRNDLWRSQVVTIPNYMEPYTQFEATLSLLSKEEGGRNLPFFSGYQPNFNFWDSGIKGEVTVSDEDKMGYPGTTIHITGTLTKSMAMKIGTKFQIMEGSAVVGTGTVIRTIQ